MRTTREERTSSLYPAYRTAATNICVGY